MTTEEKFNAAVNVIRSLPKNGSYQPSNELMLRFYGFFKQATEGPCKGARPAFWDIVGRAKFDAWKKLADMPKSEAMAEYVNELHAIVETMSYSDKIANFLEAPTNELDSIPMNDLELVAGDVMKKVRSQTNSPLTSRDASPVYFHQHPNVICDPDQSEDSNEEYIDTIEAPEMKIYMNGIQRERVSRSQKTHLHVDISAEMKTVVQSLQKDMNELRQKVQQVEETASSLAHKSRNYVRFSPSLVALVIFWPFLCTLITNRFLRKH